MAAGPASAQIVQTTAVPFLQIEPDSRAAGMGMTGVAVADNAAALFWNPAGLAAQTGTEVAFTHAPWLPNLGADLFFEYLAGRHHLEGIGTFAGHVTFLNLGEQERTDEQGNSLGTFRSYDLAVGASYGTQVRNNLSVGGGLRLIYSNLASGIEVGGQETRAGVAVAADLGVLYRLPAFGDGRFRPSVGLNLANMGPSIQYSDNPQSDPIPTNIRLGTAITANLDEYNRITWAFDANKLLVDKDSSGQAAPFYEALFTSWGSITVDIDGPPEPGETNNQPPETVGVFRQFTYGTGLEYWYNNLFALRAGYFYEDPSNGNRQFATFGAGFRYNLVGADLSYIYALEENSPLADQLRLSLTLNLNR